MNKTLYAAFLFLFFASCNLINPKEEVPTYLHLEPFIFTNADSSFTGSSFYNIPSAKVYIDDQPVGTFDLPCTVPVMTKKTGSVLIVPAVTNQGLKSMVFAYPFYKSDTVTLQYNPGKIQNYTPKTRYSPDLTSTSFRFKINFEEGLLFKNLSGSTNIALESDPAKVIEGKYSGALYLDQSKKTSESISTNYFGYLANQTYLEVDYRCNIPFQIGMQAEDASGSTIGEYLAGFYPKETRNKVYIDLSTFMNKYRTYTKFYLKVRSTLEEDDGKYTQGYVLLDNFKVISR